MTDPRATLGTARDASASARLPALVPPKGLSDEKGTLAFFKAIKERLEVREGERNNPLERAVTHRELQQTYGIRSVITAAGKPGTIFVQDVRGNTIALSAEHFATMIAGTRLWQDLSARIDDPNRFNRFGDRVKALLLPDLAELAARSGAAITSIDTILQSAGESFAARQTTLTAAVGQVVAGIRETLWASASNLSATAGYALQITARLDNFGGASATVEEIVSATADRTAGLAAEYYVKVSAGNAVAGFGLAASEDPLGNTESDFIVQADKMAFTSAYNFAQETTPTATLIGQTWYKPSTKTSYRATATGTGNWVTFTPKVLLGLDTVNDALYIDGTVLINAGGTALEDLPALSTSYWLTSSVGAVLRDTTATYVPATITFSGFSAVGTTGPAAYSGRFKIYHSTDGSTFTLAYTSSANESSKTYTPPSGKVAIKCELYLAGGTTTKIDETIVPVVDAGSDALTVVISNPSQTVPSSSAGVVSAYTSTGTTIQVFEGATLLTFTTGTIGDSKYTCGTPTVSPAGKITAGARSGNGTTTLTVADHSAMDNATDSVQITYPLTIQKADGSSVSWSAKQVITKGKTGSSGARGSLNGTGFQYGIRSSAWDDTLAQRVIENMNTGATLTTGIATGSMTAPGMVLGDQVTLGNGNPWWATEGAYSSGTTYDQNEIVISSSVAYRSRQPGNVGHTPASNPTYWLSLGAINATGAWATSHAYSQNDTATSGGVTYLARWKHTSDASALATDLATADVAVTKYWGGAAWLLPGVFIDGNLLVTGTASADVLYGGTIGGVDINLTGTARFKGSYAGAEATAAVYANESNNAITGVFGRSNATVFADGASGVGVWGYGSGTDAIGVVGVADTNIGVSGLSGGSAHAGVRGNNTSTGPSVEAETWLKVGTNAVVEGLIQAGGTTQTDAAVIGMGTGILHGGRFYNTTHTTAVILGSGASSGAALNYDVYGDGTGLVGPFTGGHDGLIPKDSAAMPAAGDIVVDVRCMRHADVSNTIFEVATSSAPMQKVALGVASGAPGAWTTDFVPNALKTWVETDGRFEQQVTPEGEALVITHDALTVNAVGEGQMNVCGEGGDIEAGDYICTSSIPGKGMRQPSFVMTLVGGSTMEVQVLCNITVGKAREAVTFSGPDDIKTVACSYHCG